MSMRSTAYGEPGMADRHEQQQADHNGADAERWVAGQAAHGSVEPDARIERTIQQVDGEIHQTEQQRESQRYTLHERDVTL